MDNEREAMKKSMSEPAQTKFFFEVIGDGPYQVKHKSGIVFPLTFPTVDRADDLINNIKDKANWDFDSFDKLPYWVQLVLGETVRDVYDRKDNEGYLQ